jgi:2,3-bisphosphoglycerate-independent phosphoglycerate mutase
MIMDGVGIAPPGPGNAAAAARRPVFDGLWSTCPHTELDASGIAVGLPEGQMGNSEVGHLNIGAGRLVYQEVTRIDLSVDSSEFFENEVLCGVIDGVRQRGGRLHLMGLVSDGQVHSSLKHLHALLDLAKKRGADDAVVHCFTDGRDTLPTSGAGFVSDLTDRMKKKNFGRIASVCGRYYAMDRDCRWDRTERAYRAVVFGDAPCVGDPVAGIKASYGRGVTDEFIEPFVVADPSGPVGGMRDSDGVVFFNFRADRARQLSLALTEHGFSFFSTDGRPDVELSTLTWYADELDSPVAFPKQTLDDTLGHIVSRDGGTQLRIAETEKYPHVTFFFSGGREGTFRGEHRELIPSPKVATYDLQPEMSAREVTDRFVRLLSSRRYDLVVLNFANGDMVGHTGVIPAAIAAVETVDECVGRAVEAVLAADGFVLLTADHGNSEKMLDPETGGPFTAHTTNPVPFVLIGGPDGAELRSGGSLCDIAPTVLDLWGVEKPDAMTGVSLLAGDSA